MPQFGLIPLVKVLEALLLLFLILPPGAPAQTNYQRIHSFNEPDVSAHPSGTLSEGTDGALYGTTFYGGVGTVFKVSKTGRDYVVLHGFAGSGGDGYFPWAGVTETVDGWLCGTTIAGGTNNFGTIFKLSKDGTAYQVLHRFVGGQADGVTPYAALVKNSDGALYGTTSNGGTNDAGTVFKLNADGSGYKCTPFFYGG